MSGRNPSLYCTLTLIAIAIAIAMQGRGGEGYQKQRRQKVCVKLNFVTLGLGSDGYSTLLCVLCVYVLSFHLLWTSDLWTHQPGPHRRKVIQDFSTFCGASLKFYREKDLAVPFPRRP